jgi:hypothetical protein
MVRASEYEAEAVSVRLTSSRTAVQALSGVRPMMERRFAGLNSPFAWSVRVRLWRFENFYF